jgi:hypothetical protein
VHSACIEPREGKRLMRCVIVNGARLKAEVSCAHCGRTIGEGYVRDMRNRLIYCNFDCYRVAVRMPPVALEQRAIAPNGWMRRS